MRSRIKSPAVGCALLGNKEEKTTSFGAFCSID
jgi:hypothetical protein